MTLGRRLFLIRTEARIQSCVVAERAGTTFSAYSSMERGFRKNISIDMLIRIANVYGMTLSQLFEGVDDVAYKKR